MLIYEALLQGFRSVLTLGYPLRDNAVPQNNLSELSQDWQHVSNDLMHATQHLQEYYEQPPKQPSRQKT